MSESRAQPPGTKPAFVSTQIAFAGHIRDPDHKPRPADVEDRRMAIYRDLFFNNVSGLLQTSLPVLREITSDERWDAMIRDFLVKHRCHTPLFLELSQEFLDYIAHEREPHPLDPPFLLELAHYEWVELALDVSEESIESAAADPDGDLLRGAPLLSPLAWNLSYRFPVHRIGPDFQPDAPGDQLTHLVVYRNREDHVGFLEINVITQRLLQLLQENPNQSGLKTVKAIAVELNQPDSEQIISAGAQLLEDMRAKDVILGTWIRRLDQAESPA